MPLKYAHKGHWPVGMKARFLQDCRKKEDDFQRTRLHAGVCLPDLVQTRWEIARCAVVYSAASLALLSLQEALQLHKNSSYAHTGSGR